LSTAAERYARFKNQQSIKENWLLSNFLNGLKFPIDDFQIKAISAIDKNESVLVAAPTGAGKTLIAEYGIEKAIANKKRLFYTTPIKALSNQKYRDFATIFGESNLGLLTGDRKINPYAPILVMTTEILRNMIYSESQDIQDLGWVVMDEVHYLADKFRGAVWEETLILLPKEVGLICLSATVSNAEEFGNWLSSVRGTISVVVDENRPTPLWQLVYHEGKLINLFSQKFDGSSAELNPAIGGSRNIRSPRSKSTKVNRGGGMDSTERMDLIGRLESENKLPAIFFIFSRNGCDKAAQGLASRNFSLLSKTERTEAIELCKLRTTNIDLDDLNAVDFDGFIDYVSKGIATHHAGMLPIFKELVEELFQLGLIKVVFATETLALGINMPARTVVVESLRKFDGTRHVDLTPGEFTQLTGRAGRRGIDKEGYSVVPTSANISPQVVASLASARTYPLRSSFKPSYNMSLNLIDKYGIDRSVKYLESSFAQYQLDRQVSHLVDRARNLENRFKNIKSEIGDEFEVIENYFLKCEEITNLERESRIRKAFQNVITDVNDNPIRPGSVIYLDSQNVYIVIDVNMARSNFSLISSDSGYQKLYWNDLERWPTVFDYIKIPRGFNPRDKLARRRLLSQIKTRPNFPSQKSDRTGIFIEKLKDQITDHAFHKLENRESKLRLMKSALQVNSDFQKLQIKIGNRTSSLGRQFKQISNLLKDKGYLTEENMLTPSGVILANIYSECDLLIAESITRGLLQGLTYSELAAVLSLFIYEGKQSQDGYATSVPTRKVKEVLIGVEALLLELQNEEHERGIPKTRSIDASFSIAIHDWISKVNLDTVLEESNLAPGDFVRWVKQIIDLSNQLINCDIDESLKRQLRNVKVQANYGIIYISDSSIINVE
jgi:ATP-dependent RNA helicase HelY